MVYTIDKPINQKFRKNAFEVEKPKVKPNRGFLARKFVEFCNRTDLHGYKYIVMEDLNNLERSCWAVAVLVSVVIGVYFVISAYKWYARNPIVTVIESTQGAIWDVPFPAVTICDLNLISRRAARAFADNLTLLPENVTADFVFETVRYAPLLHATYIVSREQKRNLYKLQTVLDINNVSMEQLFRQLSPVTSCDQLVERCMWKNTVYRCDQLFQQVFTLQNLCCSFNYYAVEGTSETLKNTGSPRRVASCGYQTALTVLLNTETDDYYSALLASQGALVFIDDAYNVPDIDSPVRLINPSTEVMIALSPEFTYSTPGIRAFPPQQRQCYFYDEIKIGDFKQYSFHNCVTLKKVELVKEMCECIPFYFPLKDFYRTCNFHDLECLENVIRLDKFESEPITSEVMECLPECEHFNYDFEVALGALAKTIKLNGHPFFTDMKLENRSLLNVFFNDLVSTKYRRDVYLNWQNLLSAFGGLLSLMLGYTLISGFDLFLFFTFRVAYDSISELMADKKLTRNNKVESKVTVQRYYPKKKWFEGNVKFTKGQIDS